MQGSYLVCVIPVQFVVCVCVFVHACMCASRIFFFT